MFNRACPLLPVHHSPLTTNPTTTTTTTTQPSVVEPPKDWVLGYSHPNIGNAMLPTVKITFTTPSATGVGAGAVDTCELRAGWKVKSGADDQIYFVV